MAKIKGDLNISRDLTVGGIINASNIGSNGIIGCIYGSAPSQNITLSGDSMVDDTSGLSVGTMVFIWQQTDPIENGIYLTDPINPWTRASHFQNGDTIATGFQINIGFGSSNSLSSFMFQQSTNVNPFIGIFGTDQLSFNKMV